MLIALWLVRIYSWILIAWALSSWIGGFPDPLGGWLGMLASPVVLAFGWIHVGPVNFSIVIGLLILFAVEGWLKSKLPAKPRPPAASQDR